MAALTADRNTPSRGEKHRKIVMKVSADAVIYAGAFVCQDADGFAVPAGDTAGLVATNCGRAEHAVDNTGGADGDLTLEVSRGVFLADISGSVVQATIGDTVMFVDDHTVGLAAATTNDIPAGVLEEIDPVTAKAWVRMLP